MPRCATCAELTRTTGKCDYFSRKLGYDKFISLDYIHKGGRCDGYKWVKPVEVST